jgi:hypothetical protein
MKVIGLGVLFLALAVRLAWWEYWPLLLPCCLFWFTIVTAMVLIKNWFYLPGILCNAVATIANDGVMPVYGTEVTSVGIHVQGTPDMNLQFLCDRFFGGTSLGDFLVFGALCIFFITKLRTLPKHLAVN